MTTTHPATHPRTPARSWRARALLIAAIAVFSGVAPQTIAAPTPDPNLDQQVNSAEEVDESGAEIALGHVDIGPKIIEGDWNVLARDDSGNHPVWRTLDNLIIRVSDAGKMTAPTDPAFDFLGDVQGQDVWVIPQTQNLDVVWLGWNTQDPQVAASLERGATMSIDQVVGPGRMWLFLQDGLFGEPSILADSATPGPHEVWMESNTHVHANWVFSEPGAYAVSLRVHGDTIDGGHEQAAATLHFAVGDQVSAEEVLALEAGEARSENPGESQSAGGGADTDVESQPINHTAQEESTSQATLILIAAALLFIGGAIAIGVAMVKRGGPGRE